MLRSPQTIHDSEFGDIIVKRRTGARSVRIHLGTGGQFTVSCGQLTPLKFIREFIDQSRGELRRMVARTSIASPYQHGQIIGRQHRIAVVPTQMVEKPSFATLASVSVMPVVGGEVVVAQAQLASTLR